MNRYIALIRGINVGGNNKVSMAELKSKLEKAAFSNVSTYINSGNLIFSTPKTDLVKLVSEIEHILLKDFSVKTYVSVISVTEFCEAVDHAPLWWGKDPTGKNDAFFVIAPATADEIIESVGEAKPEYEKIHFYKHLIFWSAPLKTYSRTRWSKIIGTPAYQKVTMRNSNTVRKLYDLVA